jgi:uncharacterized membrane protein
MSNISQGTSAARLLLGALAGALALVASVAALRAVAEVIRGAHASSGLGLVLPGFVSPAIMAVAGALLFRVAFRNLFWSRYVAALRRAHPTTSPAPPPM